MPRTKRRKDRNGRNGRPPRISAAVIKASADGLMTIREFCDWASISERQYYKQRREGRGPPEIRLNPRVIRIDKAEARAWVIRMKGGEP